MPPLKDSPGGTHERGLLSLMMSMIGTRLELAVLDTETHLQATLSAMLTLFIAVVLALISFAFIGVVVIVIFWDSHRVAAAASVLVAYASLAAIVGLMARSAWRSRPPAFAATLRELELDRAAFRSQM
jgi:uncharacterized membrane protein YqjE